MFVLQAEKKSKGHDRKIKVWVQKKKNVQSFFSHSVHKKDDSRRKAFFKSSD